MCILSLKTLDELGLDLLLWVVPVRCTKVHEGGNK